MKYAASKTDSRKALAMLQANGLTFHQAVDLKNEAEARKGERAYGHGGWMTAHAEQAITR